MTETRYPLPDGTALVHTQSTPAPLDITDPCTLAIAYPDHWTREGWITGCAESMQKLSYAGIVTEIASDDYRFTAPQLRGFLTEQVTTLERRYDLLSLAEEYRGRTSLNTDFIPVDRQENYYTWTTTTTGNAIDHMTYNGTSLNPITLNGS